MTTSDRMKLFRQMVEQKGQAAVARELGYSGSTISQVINGKYAGGLETLLQKVYEIYGGEIVHCPVLGDIPLARCAALRRKPFRNTNRQAVMQYRACRKCPRNR